MPFNSIPFLLFYLLFIVIYYCFKSKRSKTIILIAGSWIFYAYTNIFNLFHLLFTILITLYFSTKIRREPNNKWLLIIGVTIITSQLVFSKYLFALAKLFSLNPHDDNLFLNNIVLPIGISFYTLQAISLLVDIYKRKFNDEIDFSKLSLFLSLFPQSISGPIHRAADLFPQFETPKKFLADNIAIGLKTILFGFFCKLIVADKISVITTPVFSSFAEYDGISILIAILLYSFQIYFDFWGYSLIAIGIGRTIGFEINLNFCNPYRATSFRDFWHRWHITLSKWMRDYVYIPLGGRSKISYIFYCSAIIITFLASGFWHGATANFFIWGMTHAFLYLTEDCFRQYVTPFFRVKVGPFFKKTIRFFTRSVFFIVLSFTWLIFRTESLSEFVSILKIISSPSDWSLFKAGTQYLTVINISYLFIILITIYLSQTDFLRRKTGTVPITFVNRVSDFVFIFICITLIILWGDIGGQEFLYFKF